MTFVALEDVLGSVGVEPRQRKNALSFREKPAQLDDNGPGLERNTPSHRCHELRDPTLKATLSPSCAATPRC